MYLLGNFVGRDFVSNFCLSIQLLFTGSSVFIYWKSGKKASSLWFSQNSCLLETSKLVLVESYTNLIVVWSCCVINSYLIIFFIVSFSWLFVACDYHSILGFWNSREISCKDFFLFEWTFFCNETVFVVQVTQGQIFT